MAGIGFTEQVKREKRQAIKSFNKKVTKAAIAAWKKAVDSTPVLTGNLRGNWKLSAQRRSSYVPMALRRGYPATPDFSFDIESHKRVYLFNNTPYASFVNDGLGRGVRVPRLMIQKARDTFEAEMAR